MKRCPACSRTYPDDQNFCFEDGTTLVNTFASPSDSADAPTANYPYRSSAAPTEVLHGQPTISGGPVGTAPPPAYVAPYMQSVQKKRSPLLWIVGVVVALGIAVGVILFLSSRGTGTGSSSSASWETVNESGFSISMPGSPAKTEQTTPSPAGPLPIYMYTLSHGYEGYITGYTVYPDYIFSASNPSALLDGVQQGAMSNLEGQVTSQREIMLAGNPGREIIGTSPSKNISFTARLYIVKPRMYMIVYSQFGKDKPISDHGKKFLDSFQIKADSQNQNSNQAKP